MIGISDLRNANVLIVDDQEANVKLLTYLLRAAGYTAIDSTMNSREVVALYAARRHDIIVLDLHMPLMNGFEVLDALKAVEIGGYLPVLVMTADPDSKVKALAAGAKDFISKPFDTVEVLTRIQNLLEVRLLHKQLLAQNSLLELKVEERTAALRESLASGEASRRRLHDLQNELAHLSRYFAMGEMAATLAHELNQPLTAITSTLNGCRRLLANQQTPEASMLKDAVDRAAEQALRAGQIIRRLRDFVARGESERRVETLSALIDEASALALIGIKQTGIIIGHSFDPGVTLVLVDKIQIQQVILNLLRNAIEAMQDMPKRQLTIATHKRADDLVEVSVTDSGPGIAPEIADRLFQSFVTTKSQGMGIGLSISRTIIETHGGQLWVEPNPDGGTIFRFTLRSMSEEELNDSP